MGDMTLRYIAFANALLVFALPLPSLAQSVPEKSRPIPSAVSAKIATILARPGLKNASVGVFARSLRSGKVTFERNADLSLVPASNQKILTATTALRTLGSAYQYRTAVCTVVAPDAEGTLRGDLFLRGSGDPSLTTARLDALAGSLAKTGIKRVIGRIVGDGTAFDNQMLGSGWQWDDESYYYSPQVSGLNCDGNVVAISVRPGARIAEPATVLINGRPVGEETYITVENRVQTVLNQKESVAKIAFERVRGMNRIIISGTIPVGAKEESEAITIEDPSRFSASRFVLALVKAGIAVETPLWIEAGATPNTAREVAASESKPLSELIKDFLKPSDNLYGEALLKTVGRGEARSGSGTISEGGKRIGRLLEAAKIDRGGLHVSDGSGLSVQNTVTPRLLCDLLIYVDAQFAPAERDAFTNGLPVGGIDGTLRGRFKNTPLAGNVRAKTGTLFGASSLSGYVTAKGGERFAFSILMNHAATAADARQAQDAIVAALYDGR
ncbi:MAG: D-alanyl-D-alanine carboxypeptidase/D-alanyl-D-alanine-endopeptidase [Akkermansiaceae bacterium]|nr:D-alanyl-D-alanine carboxypeptidase/D-alanyl-D-alanine-endopeptidase [Armatimonadota bacterium]